MSRKALGKGIKALIPDLPGAGEKGVTTIPIRQISPNPYQPRKNFTPEPLDELVESIRSQGLLQPILVKKSSDGYELIAGERRWRAAIKAGLNEIPALVKVAGRQESLAMALVENIQRENLNPIDAALAYQSLVNEFHLTQEEVARTIGKDRASVANYLRLLKLPMVIQEDLVEERLSMGHARALLAISDKKVQIEARDKILAKGLSVREAEALAKKASRKKRSVKASQGKEDHDLVSLQEELKRRLGTKVKLVNRGRGGSIQIFYNSLEELERLLDTILGR